ncbi:hypothetical protein JCM31739_02190 [Faecalimonas canis]
MVKYLKKRKRKYIFVQSIDENIKLKKLFHKNDSFSVQKQETIV